MAGHSRVTTLASGPQVLGGRLDSWKEIASYLKRHVTTARRWERLEGLPVHRHRHGTLGSVYAYASELDAWFRGRSPAPAEHAGAAAEAARDFHLPPPTLLGIHTSSPVPLLGRDAEWRSLETRWDAARQGRHQLVVLTGEPGIGKSRLAFEFARSVASNAAVLVGRCDREQLVPFAPFVELLQWLVRVLPAALLRERLADVDGSIELAQLLPDLATRLRMRSASVPLTTEGRRYRMFEAFAGLLRATSRREPILLVIEDVHWADRGSMLLLRHLVRAAYDARICTIVTYCEAEASRSAWCEEIVADLRREPSATHVALGGLSEGHVRDFVGAWTDHRAAAYLAELVAGSTQGNPLFIIEMLRHLSDPVMLSRLDAAGGGMNLTELGLPQSLRELIGRRLSGLSDSCNKLLTLAAVTGREFHISTVEALDGRSEEVVLDCMDEAVAANVLREVPSVPGRFSFTHAIVRETLYSRLTAARRVRVHSRVAQELERQSASGTVPLAELAHHFHQAAAFKDAAKAVDYTIRAAEHAASGLALEEAARYYEMAIQALDFLPHDPALGARRFELRERRGRSFFQVGQWALARNEFEAALTLLRAGDEVRRCELLVNLAETAFWLMDVPALRRFAAGAQRLAEAVHRDDLWADALAWMSSADIADGDMSGAVESDRRAVARAGGIRSFGLARVPLTLYWAGHMAEAVEAAAQAVERARGSGDPAFLLYALQHWGLSLSGAGCYDDALEVFEEAQTFGRRCGALPLLARALSMSVAPLLSLGDLEGATTRALDARALAHRVAFEPPIVSAGIDLLLIAARSGAPERSDPLLPEVASAAEKASGWHAWKWRLRLWQARAELALARRDWNGALIAAAQAVEQSRARKRPKYEALGQSARARAEAGLGLKGAMKSAREATAVGRRLGDPAVLLNCLNVSLEIDPRDATRREADEIVQRVLTTLSPEPLRRRFLAGLPGAIRAQV